LELELLFVGIAEARLASPLLQALERLWNQGSDERSNTRTQGTVLKRDCIVNLFISQEFE
jgi:hypothetical protein